MKKLRITLFLVMGLVVILGAGCQNKDEEATVTVPSDEQWSSTTDAGGIPTSPLAGELNGQAFTMESAIIQEWDGEYEFSFSSLAPSDTCGVVTGDNAVHFSSKVLQTGTFEKTIDEEIAFEDYHSYYHYQQENGAPMSVNVEWKSKIVITEIDDTNNKVKGYADIEFEDCLTKVAGSFTADLCK